MAKGSRSERIDPLHDIVLDRGTFSHTNAEDLKRAFDKFTTGSERGHLCVFFHGGLVSETAGLEQAGRLVKNFADSGAYPFFFIWKSDLLSAVSAILEPPAKTRSFVQAANDLVWTMAAKIVQARDADPGLRALPRVRPARKAVPMTLEQLASAARLYDRAWRAGKGEQLGCSTAELEQFGKRLAQGDQHTRPRLFLARNLRGVQNPLARIVHRFNTGHDHGLYTTVIEELLIAAQLDKAAATVWDTMKSFIERSFEPDKDAGGTAFLDHLRKAWQADPSLRVTLIGHSAGAIYVQRFIEVLDERIPPDTHRPLEVVLVAAALSCRRLNAGLPALRRRVGALRAFGLDNTRESSYWEVKGVYNKSLLYIVCSLCERDLNADRALVGMQRYWSGQAPYDEREIVTATKFIGAARAVWAPTDADAQPGYRSQADRHGGFPEERCTNESICFGLKNGLSDR